MGLQNSHERDSEEWEAVIREADARFKVKSIVKPLGSELAMIQVQ